MGGRGWRLRRLDDGAPMAEAAPAGYADRVIIPLLLACTPPDDSSHLYGAGSGFWDGTISW